MAPLSEVAKPKVTLFVALSTDTELTVIVVVLFFTVNVLATGLMLANPVPVPSPRFILSVVPFTLALAKLGNAVSNTKPNEEELLVVLPATSVSLTIIALLPSPDRVTEVPEPAVHVKPAFILYCHEVPEADSSPLTLTTPVLDIASVLLVPESEFNANVGTLGAKVSSVKAIFAVAL